MARVMSLVSPCGKHGRGTVEWILECALRHGVFVMFPISETPYKTSHHRRVVEKIEYF